MQTARIAEKVFRENNVKNISQIVGNIDIELPKLLKNTETVDFVFFDGNHRKEPTLDYFRQCAAKANNDTIFVFDDIHWTKDMEQAWKQITNHPDVTATIDLFFQGIVFFRKEMQKQKFVIEF